MIITGATGMVGKGVLLACLDSAEVSEVLTIGRRPTGVKNSKLQEVAHKDFSDFSTVADQLSGYDACYHCMGVSAAGLKEDEYQKLTFEYTEALASTLVELNTKMTFIYVSGQGTDSSEQGRSMWARVKGKTENALLNMGFKKAFMFRPGGIIPKRGIKSSTRLYQFFYDYFMWLILLIKWVAPNAIVDTTQLGLAMINCTQRGYSKTIIDPKDIIVLAKPLESV